MMRQLIDFVDSRQRTDLQIGLFVDFDDIVDNVPEEVARDRSLSAVLELSGALQNTLCDGKRGRFLIRRVFGDFEALPASGNGLQYELAMNGIEPRFVPNLNQSTMSDTALCVDVMQAVGACRDMNVVVIATGARSYLPLVHHLIQHGKMVVLVTFGEVNLPVSVQRSTDVFVLDGMKIVQNGQRPPEAARPIVAPKTSFYPARELAQGLCRDALWIIEEFFGQYEEIYLTPLLRRLSEELDTTEEYDPKAVISDLELSGAVRLEKRRGEPYDYTVLILNEEHPDVQKVRVEFSSRSGRYYAFGSEDGHSSGDQGSDGGWQTDGEHRKMEDNPPHGY